MIAMYFSYLKIKRFWVVHPHKSYQGFAPDLLGASCHWFSNISLLEISWSSPDIGIMSRNNCKKKRNKTKLSWYSTAGHFWIGISDIVDENRWTYSSDLQVIRVNSFHSGEPNDHTSGNCVALWKPFHGYWADEVCSRRYNFICERPQE